MAGLSFSPRPPSRPAAPVTPAQKATGEALAQLLTLPGVGAAVEAARDACTQVRWHEALRRRSAEVRAEATIRSARSSAALEGARYPTDLVRDVARGAGQFPADASGDLARAALRVLSEARDLESALASSPSQALARLHVAAAAGLVPAEQVGRPRQPGETPGDGVGEAEDAPVGAALRARLNGITDLLAAPADRQNASVVPGAPGPRPGTCASSRYGLGKSGRVWE